MFCRCNDGARLNSPKSPDCRLLPTISPTSRSNIGFESRRSLFHSIANSSLILSINDCSTSLRLILFSILWVLHASSKSLPVPSVSHFTSNSVRVNLFIEATSPFRKPPFTTYLAKVLYSISFPYPISGVPLITISCSLAIFSGVTLSSIEQVAHTWWGTPTSSIRKSGLGVTTE